jgi:hypothetical protein
MLLLWGLGALLLTVLGLAGALWVMSVALFAVGGAISAATVIWGTLLQRRVPYGLRGRVSSLDFFVSLTLMPISMAVADPAGAAFGITAVFLVARSMPGFLAALAILLPRLDRDERAHPLDHPATDEPVPVRRMSGSRASRGSHPPAAIPDGCSAKRHDLTDDDLSGPLRHMFGIALELNEPARLRSST